MQVACDWGMGRVPGPQDGEATTRENHWQEARFGMEQRRHDSVGRCRTCGWSATSIHALLPAWDKLRDIS